MKKKIFYILIAIIILAILSQWLMVKMVYSKTIRGDLALGITKLYNLKAATVHKNNETLHISLEDFLDSEIFAKKLLDIKLVDDVDAPNAFSLKKESDINYVVWDNVIKKVWLEQLADRYNLTVTNGDLNAGLIELQKNNLLDLSKLAKLGISEKDYMEKAVRPFVLESKVYAWLLDNYNDLQGMQRAQSAYQALESGSSHSSVFEVYSDKEVFSDELFWIKESDLVYNLEPVKSLEPGGFSKIVISETPMGVYYTIWYLDSKTTEDEEASFGVRGIYIKARTLDQFYDDYLAGATIKKLY